MTTKMDKSCHIAVLYTSTSGTEVICHTHRIVWTIVGIGNALPVECPVVFQNKNKEGKGHYVTSPT